ncbi:hypothetical protein FQR65_LT12202 [Abscondita terminalis]|nr:hypothetical protein FQR65_LT12202 [Abscondita terminalis]
MEEEQSLECYPMTKEKSGNVYVFSHSTFDNPSLSPKYNVSIDCKQIEETFKTFNFDVIIYHDLTYAEIQKELSKIAEMDYTNFDCLVICVLSYGKHGKIFAKDVDYHPDVYWKMLNEKNSSFLSKPKFIFVHASRGDELEEEKMSEVTETFPIPQVPDILLVYSSYDRYSWDGTSSGSWIVSHLCRTLNNHANKSNILSLITRFNRNKEACQKLSSQPNKLVMVQKDVWTVFNTLTRSLFFKTGNK